MKQNQKRRVNLYPLNQLSLTVNISTFDDQSAQILKVLRHKLLL